jgi:hypothetical protein
MTIISEIELICCDARQMRSGTLEAFVAMAEARLMRVVDESEPESAAPSRRAIFR